MKWTGLNDLREQYLSFFESKGHTRMASAPLIPKDDNSLLLINSGMAPLKKFFLGQATPPNSRVTTCQKCIRTPDIEQVGKTARHGTYFEMLGNFSFGDYFKHEATAWAWEFITKVLELPLDKLWVTIYQDDDEAFDIWTKEVGVDPGRIVRLGKEDNFWEHGSGPCGPCSEIYFDRGEAYGCGSPTCGPGCECDRFMEFWNLVFSQFDSDGSGHYELMPKPNIDTGMGLERLACLMQGVDNLFEVDTVQNIMKKISGIAGVAYKHNPKSDVSLRVITDHIRSTTFMLADGVSPSNEGRGYVLRRLLRRAARHGRLLGVNEPFLYKVVDTVVAENISAYPELAEKAAYIKKVMKNEEEAFNNTIGKGMDMLSELIDRMSVSEIKTLSGAEVFRLYDTYGFPMDLTREIVAEKGLDVDVEGFETFMREQKTRSRENYLSRGGSSWESEELDLPKTETEFVGYGALSCEAQLAALLVDGKPAEVATEGEEVVLLLDKTAFYTESGGQVSDTGVVKGARGAAVVTGMKKLPSGQTIHLGYISEGTLEKGEAVEAQPDEPRRRAIMRNHTAAHLLQAALRQVLGDHVHQAGQLVDGHAVRFDFTHFEPVSPEQLREVENLINQKILSCIPVGNYECGIEEARSKGAMALFSEKYGDVVRVVEVGDYSLELCGGTHVKNTGELGLFKVVSESSVAAGVRRIEAVTGFGVIELFNQTKGILDMAAATVKAAVGDLPQKLAALNAELKERDREIASLNGKIASGRLEELRQQARRIKGVGVLNASFNGVPIETLRMMGDKLRDIDPCSCLLLCGGNGDKPSFICMVGPEAVKKGVHAGKIIKEVCQKTGGKGGGRPDSAQGGVGDPFKVDEAMALFDGLVESMAAE
ncbi:MAG: alanine--tRNA ligase [Oscillospiraceae bacterium]|nr:alanine--tRNA ligase [Oscillospiraceae bacterium]